MKSNLLIKNLLYLELCGSFPGRPWMEIKVRLLNFRRGLWKEKERAQLEEIQRAHPRNNIAQNSMFRRIQKAIPLHRVKVFHSAQMQVSLDTKRTISTTVSAMPGRGGGQDWQYVELNVIWHLKTSKYDEWLSLLIFKAFCKLRMDWCKWYKGIRMFFINQC